VRLLLAFLAIAACDRGLPDPVEPVVPPAPPPAVEPAKPAPPKPVPAPALGKITHLFRYDNQTLCVRDAAGLQRCRQFDKRFHDKPIAVTDAKPDSPIELTRAGAACSYRDGELACGASKTPMTVRSGGFHLYLIAADNTVSYFEPSNSATPVLETLAPLAGGIAQVEIGFRVGCARTTTAEVWCWSDPKKPKRVVTPPNVVEIALQDPFELCVRTGSGELHCTPPYTQREELFCSKSKLACGTGGVEQVELKTSFDPLTKVLRPLARVALAHRATDVDPDNDPLYQFCLDSLFVQPTNAGACMLGDNGNVSCVSACNGRWRVGKVTGLPSTITRTWSEGATGYALASDGALWWWPRARDCSGPANASATRFANLPPIAELAEPLSLQTGPQSWEPLRCALATNGDVRCWQTHRDTGVPGKPIDPMQ